MNSPHPRTEHPRAQPVERLLADHHAEQRWRARFSARRYSLPVPARDAPDRAAGVSNESGRFELYCWDLASGQRTRSTDRVDGTTIGTLSADGNGLWWFDDTSGDEFGRWMAQPFGAGPGSASEAMPGVPPGYPAGIEVGRQAVLVGFNDDEGTRVHLRAAGGEPSVVYRHHTDGSVAALTRDEQIWVLAHSEHGDSRYPSLRSLSVRTGQPLAELSDAPGRGLAALDVSPVAGDQRVLVGHERRGRDELLVWDAATGEVLELDIDLPGDLSGCFYPGAQALLVVHGHAGRTTLHRYDLAANSLTMLPAPTGTIDAALTRDDGDVWYRWSSGASAPRLAVLPATPGAGHPALFDWSVSAVPGSQQLHDLWVDGPGGDIHALVSVPPGAPAPEFDGRSNLPLPAVFLLHGGPESADEDSFDAVRATWLDAGFAVVHVNYRGSTGYGSAWRDALATRVGHTELADVAAVQDRLVALGVVDVSRCVLAGASWGGFLTLLGLGAQPLRWAAGVAGVPVADYPAAYQQEMEPLRAYDRALFGGSPEQVPDSYIDSSPLTWVDQVGVPLLVLAGRNDPRCPIGQVENYLRELADRGVDYRWYCYDTGHGSMVVDERIRQVALEVAFARAAVDAD